MAGLRRPKCPDQEGDSGLEAPQTSDRILLGSERGTDQTRRMETDGDRNLYVNVGKMSGISSALSQGSAASVVSAVLTTITSYTATANTAICKVSCSGSDYGQFRLLKNSTLIDVRRTGPSRNVDFVFECPLALVATDLLEVKVIHQDGSVTPDFDATIYGA